MMWYVQEHKVQLVCAKCKVASHTCGMGVALKQFPTSLTCDSIARELLEAIVIGKLRIVCSTIGEEKKKHGHTNFTYH